MDDNRRAPKSRSGKGAENEESTQPDEERKSSPRNGNVYSPTVKATQDEENPKRSPPSLKPELKKQLDERYPLQSAIAASPEDRRNAPPQKQQQPGRSQQHLPKMEIRLKQISCDEAGRVNRPIDDESYYHGFMTRDEAEEILLNRGEFLIRKTEVGQHIFYVISVRSDHILHLIVKRTTKKRLFWVSIFAFKTVNDLVQYHHRHQIPVFSHDVKLIKPIFKQDWQLNHEQVTTIREIGSGQFGKVYEGWLQVSPFRARIKVAVKTLHERNMTADDKIKFLREANLMRKFSHPHVVKIYGVAAAREPIMIVMEFCPSDSLEVVIAKQQLSAADKVNYLYGAAKGLKYLHDNRVIHRDIAARNCLLDAKQNVRISDFGLSVVDTVGEGVQDRKGGRLPVKSMAPETLKKGHYTKASDVYSFGAMMYEVYNDGKEPFAESGLQGNQLKKAIINQKITLNIGSHCPEDIIELFQACRRYDPKQRPDFGKIIEMMSEMDGVIIETEQKFWEKTTRRIASFFRAYS